MLYCLNPVCQQPQNPDDTKTCRSCGTELSALLRGRYRVIQTLGQGGFGRTYLALDEDRLKTRCVIKQFSPQFHGAKSLDKAIELFAQEAQRLNELGEHPQIPSLLAYFEQDQRLYLVQQFIEGQNLAQELQRQGAFSEQKVRDVLNGLLPVLKFVHDRHVIHRDITPANVMRRHSDGKLMLIDFGVSKQLTGMNPAFTGTKIGTEGFSPIEQIRSGRAYPASDLYSLGAVCIYLLTQTNPEDLYDPMHGCWTWREHLTQKGTSVSPQLGQVLDKLLKDLVVERYQSAEAVYKELNARVAPTSTVSQPTVPPTPQPTGQSAGAVPTTPARSAAALSILSRPPASSAPPLVRPLPTKPTGSSNWTCIHTFTGHPSWITSVTISPNQQLLATGSLDDTIKIWNLQDGTLLQTLKGHSRGINCLTFTPDSKLLASGSDDDTVRLWHPTTGEMIRILAEHTRDINAVAVSADGKILASGSEDRTIRLWELPEGRLLRSLLGPAAMIKSVAITPDSRAVASAGLDNKIKLWSLESGELLLSCIGHNNSVMAIAISPDGETLASGSKDKTVRLWNLKSGRPLHVLSGHTDTVNAVAISPDGKTVISGGSDKTIRIWDMTTGELLHTLTGHLDSVNALAISADSQSLVSGGKDKTIRIWQLA